MSRILSYGGSVVTDGRCEIGLVCACVVGFARLSATTSGHLLTSDVFWVSRITAAAFAKAPAPAKSACALNLATLTRRAG